MKKTLAIILSVLMISLVFASCGQQSVNVNVNNNINNNNNNVNSAGNSAGTDTSSQISSNTLVFAGSYNVGDTIKYGSYEQDNNTMNGKEPIEWTVLDKNGDVYLLISRCALDSKPYNDSKGVTDGWNSSLEKWLCNDFTSQAFTYEEQSHLTYGMSNEYFYGNLPFLLTKAQAEKYFSSNQARICSATAYAQAQGSYVKDGACGWWLNLEEASANAPRVNIKGEILTGSSSEGGAERTDYSVRPAIYLDLSGLNYSSDKETERNRILSMTNQQFGNAYYAPAYDFYCGLNGVCSSIAVDDSYANSIYPNGEQIDDGYCLIVDSRFGNIDNYKNYCKAFLSSSFTEKTATECSSVFYVQNGKQYTAESVIYSSPDVPVIPHFAISSANNDTISVRVDGYYDLDDENNNLDSTCDYTMIYENGRWVVDNIVNIY